MQELPHAHMINPIANRIVSLITEDKLTPIAHAVKGFAKMWAPLDIVEQVEITAFMLLDDLNPEDRACAL